MACFGSQKPKLARVAWPSALMTSAWRQKTRSAAGSCLDVEVANTDMATPWRVGGFEPMATPRRVGGFEPSVPTSTHASVPTSTHASVPTSAHASVPTCSAKASLGTMLRASSCSQSLRSNTCAWGRGPQQCQLDRNCMVARHKMRAGHTEKGCRGCLHSKDERRDAFRRVEWAHVSLVSGHTASLVNGQAGAS